MNKWQNEKPYFVPRRAADPPRKTRGVQICPRLALSFVPFRLWALSCYGIVDVMDVKPYKRAVLWYEYRADMVAAELDAEHPKNFGIDFLP